MTDARDASVPQALASLTSALHGERRILEQLREALIAQRATVAAGEPVAVCAEADQISRVLLTLQEARRHRADILETLAHDPRLPLARLESVIGRPLPHDLLEARRLLRNVLEGVAFDASVNHAVLHRVLDAGEIYLQQLFAAGSPPATAYARRDARDDARPKSAMFVNRRA